MVHLYMDKDGQKVTGNFYCKHVFGEAALDYLKKGFSVEVYEDDFPVANFKDDFIETDSDGFASPVKKETKMEEKERIVKLELKESEFKAVIDYLIRQGENELAGYLFFGVENYIVSVFLKEK